MPKAYIGKGCEFCQHTGFVGRTTIYEFLPLVGPIKKLVLQGASADEIQAEAVKMGMRTLREDGWEKVRRGLTTPDEVLRVTHNFKIAKSP